MDHTGGYIRYDIDLNFTFGNLSRHFTESILIYPQLQGDTSPRVLGSVAVNLGSSLAYGPLLQL